MCLMDFSAVLLVICDRKYVFVLKFGSLPYHFTITLQINVMVHLLCFIQHNILILYFGIIILFFRCWSYTRRNLYSQLIFQHRIQTKGLHHSWWLPWIQSGNWFPGSIYILGLRAGVSIISCAAGEIISFRIYLSYLRKH